MNNNIMSPIPPGNPMMSPQINNPNPHINHHNMPNTIPNMNQSPNMTHNPYQMYIQPNNMHPNMVNQGYYQQNLTPNYQQSLRQQQNFSPHSPYPNQHMLPKQQYPQLQSQNNYHQGYLNNNNMQHPNQFLPHNILPNMPSPIASQIPSPNPSAITSPTPYHKPSNYDPRNSINSKTSNQQARLSPPSTPIPNSKISKQLI